MPDIKEKLVELIDDYTDQVSLEDFRKVEFSEDMADYLISNGVTIQQWISVEEALPKCGGRYLVRRKFGFCQGNFTDIAAFTNCYEGMEDHLLSRRIWFNNDHEGGDYELDDVTHWMPLPEPPKGE